MKLVTLSLSRQICNPLCTFVAVILVFHQQTALHSAVQCTSTTHYLLSTTHYPLQASLFTKSKTQRTFLSSRQSYWADQACSVSFSHFRLTLWLHQWSIYLFFRWNHFKWCKTPQKGVSWATPSVYVVCNSDDGFWNEKRAVGDNSNPVTWEAQWQTGVWSCCSF